jgi:hypothetical protein
MLIGVEQYMSPPASSEALTPKYMNSTALDSPMTEVPPSMATIEEAMHTSPPQVTASMQPPPLPTVSIPNQPSDMSHAGVDSCPVTPSQEEAARALEVVMSFFQQQPHGFVEPQEYVMIGKLMEKLKIKRSSESLHSGMRRVSEPDFHMTGKLEGVDAIH